MLWVKWLLKLDKLMLASAGQLIIGVELEGRLIIVQIVLFLYLPQHSLMINPCSAMN